MTGHRSFLEVTDSEDEAGIGWLLQLSRLDHRDMGRVLATYRAWPGPLFWVPFGVVWVALIILLATSPSSDELIARTGLLVVPAILSAVLLIAYGMERHRVCEHGTIVGFTKKSTFVIPWATIDPGRIRDPARALEAGSEQSAAAAAQLRSGGRGRRVAAGRLIRGTRT